MSSNYRFNEEETKIYGTLSKFIKIGKDCFAFLLDVMNFFFFFLSFVL